MGGQQTKPARRGWDGAGSGGTDPLGSFPAPEYEGQAKKTGDTGKVQAGPERAEGRAVFESSVLLELGAGVYRSFVRGWVGTGRGRGPALSFEEGYPETAQAPGVSLGVSLSSAPGKRGKSCYTDTASPSPLRF